MKKLANKAVIITLSVILSLTTLLGCGKGSLKVNKYYLNNANSVAFIKDGTVDLSNVTMTIEYSDGEKAVIENDKLTFEGVDGLTATTGEKTVTVKYDETRVNEKISTTFKVAVYEFKEEAHFYAESYEKPNSISTRETYISQASYSVEGSLTVKQENYYVGDDNAFVFLPKLTVEEGDDDIVLERFLSVVTINYDNQKLTATTVQNQKYVNDYSLNDTVYVRVDYFNQKYYFTEDAIGKSFKISVLPANNYEFDDTVKAIELTVTVVDGYNVYTAKELSVIDNRTVSEDYATETEWDSIKATAGVTGVDAKSVIIHNNISVTKNDIPEEYIWKTDKKYHYEENGVTVQDKNNGYFLYDWSEVYVRILNENDNFTIYGNSYTLDVQNIPTVCSLPEENGTHKFYGSDYSNATLLRPTLNSNIKENPEMSNKVFFNILDMNFVGNAARDEIKSYGTTNQGNLVNGGGFIFCKADRISTEFNNVRIQEFFIGFFPHSNFDGNPCILTIENCKAFDSFQNAMFVWGKTNVSVKNSQLKRTGGPVIIIQHLCDGSDYATDTTLYGNVMVDKTSVVESYLDGTEAWFVSMGATEVMPQIKGLDALFSPIGKTILNSEKKMNLACLIMSNGSNASSTMNAYWVNGSVTFEGETEDKTVTLNRQDMLANRETDIEYQMRYSAGAPMLKSNFAWLTTDGTAYYVKALDGNGFTVVNPEDLTATSTHLYDSFRSVEKYIPLNMGGFGIVLGYGNLQ